jgi:hypothetical protein
MFVGCYGVMDVMAFLFIFILFFLVRPFSVFYFTDCSCNITDGNVEFTGFVKSPKNEVCRLVIISSEGELVVYPPSYQYYNPFSTNVFS